MLNKKDPLISAVQQVMQRNQVEREATKSVNEYFGVEDRKALPHEYQGQWDAAYQQVLNEAKIDHPNKQVLDVHEPEEDELTAKDFAMLRARKKKKMAEEASLESIQEEIAYNLAEQAEYVYENYGEEGLVEFFDSLTEEQFELLEGWGDQPGSPLDRIKKYFGFGGSPTPPSNTNPGISRLNSGQGAGARQPETKKTNTVDPTKQTSGPNRGLDQSAPKAAAPAPAPIPKARPDDLKTRPAQPAKAAPKARPAQPAQAAPKKKLSFFQKQELRRSAKNDTMDQTRRLEKRYGVKPGSTRPLEEKAMGGMVAQKQKEAAAKPNAKSPMPVSGVNNSSMFSSQTDMQRATQNAGKMSKLRRMQANPPALDTKRNAALDRPNTDSPMARATNPNIGGAGGGNYSSAQTRIPMGQKRAASGDVAPGPQAGENKVGKIIRQQNLKRETQKTATDTLDNPNKITQKTPSVPRDMSGGGSDYRAAQTPARQKAAPINVSDTEVMNSPEFKKARQSVGGESGARKIAPGTRIQGLGSFNKGDTIMSRTRTHLAAKKNVGRES